MNPGGNRNNEQRRDERQNDWFTPGAAAIGLAAAAGLTYWLTSGSKEPKQTAPSYGSSSSSSASNSPAIPPNNNGTWFQGLSSAITALSSSSTSRETFDSEVSTSPPPAQPCITNLNSLLEDIHVRFIQLRDDDFRLHYKVCTELFEHLHTKMSEVDLYYNKYSSTRQFAGSHYDKLRIKKPDEFDMDIVIRLPLNLSEAPDRLQSDICLEPQSAGYVHLRMGKQFQNLYMRDVPEWETNKEAYKWMDNSNYLRCSKFMDWWKKTVSKALNTFQHRGNVPIYYIDGVEYQIKRSESGPAMTLYIVNSRTGFKLDLDLVPALKFPESRWPIGPSYRQIPAHCRTGSWMVVAKANKAAPAHEHLRSWRLALHNQEGELMHDFYNLKKTIKFMKKLRDEQNMAEISSYYIKNLFFWETVEQGDKLFWRNNPAFLFTHMVKKLHAALVNGSIPYFWNSRNNLICNVDPRTLSQYAARLVPLMQILENPSNYKMVAKYLLSHAEFKQYNEKFLHI